MANFDMEQMSECEAAIAIAQAVLAVDGDAVVCLWIESHDIEVMSTTTGECALLEAIFGPEYSSLLLLEDALSRVFSRVSLQTSHVRPRLRSDRG
jgi:hypothetical protein